MKQIYTNTLYEKLRNCLSYIKDKYNISYKEMSIRTGIPVSRIYDIRNKGYEPTIEELISFTKAFNLNLEDEDKFRLITAAGYDEEFALTIIMCTD